LGAIVETKVGFKIKALIADIISFAEVYL